MDVSDRDDQTGLEGCGWPSGGGRGWATVGEYLPFWPPRMEEDMGLELRLLAELAAWRAAKRNGESGWSVKDNESETDSLLRHHIRGKCWHSVGGHGLMLIVVPFGRL